MSRLDGWAEYVIYGLGRLVMSFWPVEATVDIFFNRCLKSSLRENCTSVKAASSVCT